MKERLISLAWAAPWMLFMGFPLAYALELTDPAQRAGLIGRIVAAEELVNEAEPHGELVGTAVVHGKYAVLVAGE